MVCTCNDISKLPPEFSRSERFDGIWFLDLPGRQQKDAIWDIYLKMFELDPDQTRPKDDQWTGAEDPSLLPIGGASGRAAVGRRPERRARGGHGGRIGRAAAAVGLGALSRCRGRGHLSVGLQSRGPRPTESQPWPVE